MASGNIFSRLGRAIKGDYTQDDIEKERAPGGGFGSNFFEKLANHAGDLGIRGAKYIPALIGGSWLSGAFGGGEGGGTEGALDPSTTDLGGFGGMLGGTSESGGGMMGMLGNAMNLGSLLGGGKKGGGTTTVTPPPNWGNTQPAMFAGMGQRAQSPWMTLGQAVGGMR